MEGNRIPKRVLYMNLGTTRLRGRPWSSWQDEVREDGRIVGGEGWQEKVRNREEWKKLLRTAMNRHTLHTPLERMPVCFSLCSFCKYKKKIYGFFRSSCCLYVLFFEPKNRKTDCCESWYGHYNIGGCPIVSLFSLQSINTHDVALNC
jgi:hypothetical protein